MHRPGADARLVSIRDVGVADWFYSRKSLDGTPTLDDAITDIERDLGASVGALRATAPGSPIDAGEAARVVVHLVMRTAHLRQVMSAGTATVVAEIESMLTHPERLGAWLGLTGTALHPAVYDSIRESAADLVTSGIPAAFSERLITFLVRELGDRLMEQAVPMLGTIVPQLLEGLAVKVCDAHNSILAVSPQGNAWVAALTAFDWTVVAYDDLILPDAVALVREADGPLMPVLFTSAADARAVVMPLSTSKMLVGLSAGHGPIDLSDFNSQAAASCEAFFIGAKPFDKGRLNALIGSACATAIQQAISAAVSEADAARSTTSNAAIAPAPIRLTQQDFSFSVRLYGFGDEIVAKEYGAVLQKVVGGLAGEMPLHELDGFTLAIDYSGALASLDRGDPDLPPAASDALSYGVGVAKSVTVIRDGARKEHLVIAAGLAEMWLSPKTEICATGLHMLVKMLTGVAYTTRYANAWTAKFTPDTMGRELHSAVATAPLSYWTARQAAFVSPNEAEAFATLVIDGLDFAARELAVERTRIPESGDITNAMMRAMECVNAVIHQAANWLGHRDGLPEGLVFAGNDLPGRLKARGLDQWIELFGRDLARCYGADGSLNLDVVTNLSQHVERIFWTLGIYCWPDGDHIRCKVSEHFFIPQHLF